MNTKKSSILIVDDSENWRELLSMMFEQEHEVCTASTYTGACQLLLEKRPYFDIAIIDLRLDDEDNQNEDGLKLLAFIQDNRLRTKTIILTGYPSVKTSRIAFRNLKAYEYIEKYPQDTQGLDIEHLRRVVQKAVENPCILVVEDDPEWSDLIANIMIEDGFNVICASNSDEALYHYKKGFNGVSIVDLKLGTKTPEEGVDLLEFASSINPESRFVVLSGYGNRERVRDSFVRGKAKAFIFKDEFSPLQLRETVRSCIL